AAHRELLELLGDPLLEAPRGPGPDLAEPCGEVRPAPERFAEPSLEPVAPLAGSLDRLDLGPAALGVRQDGLDRAAVLALQPVESLEALLDLLEPCGLGLDPL